MTRSWINNLPLRFKLILPIWLLLTTGIALVGVGVTHVVGENLEQSLIGRTHILAKGAASNLTAALAFDDKDTGHEQLEALAFDPDLVAGRVIYKNGAEFVKRLRLPADCRFVDTAPVCTQTMLERVSRPVSLGSDVLGHIDLFVSREAMEKELGRLDWFLSVGVALLSIFSWLFALLLHRFVSRPLASLHHSMSNLTRQGGHGKTIPVYHNDELGQLTTCFNDMVTSLADRDSQLNATFKQLGDKNRYINQVLDTMEHGVMVIAPGDEVTYYNPTAAKHLALMGCDPNALTQLLQMLEPASLISQLSEAIDTRKPFYNVELRHRVTDKRFLISTYPMASAQHSLVQFEDITEQYLAEQRRKMAELIFDQSQDATLVLSRKLDIEAQNAACTQMFGPLNQFPDLALEQQLHFTPHEIKVLITSGSCEWQTRVMNANGTWLPCQISVRTLDDRQGKVEAFMVSIIDQTASLELKRLNHIANHDPLTGLANRTQANERLARGHNLGRGIYVLFVDLDGFKEVNDQYGHHVGDELLKVVARRLEACVAKTDLVSRFAGDEFLLGIEEAVAENQVRTRPVNQQAYGVQRASGNQKYTAHHIAERILQKLNETIAINGVKPTVSASIGIRYWHPDDSTPLNRIIEQADKAMYGAKGAGKNGYVFSQDGQREPVMTD